MKQRNRASMHALLRFDCTRCGDLAGAVGPRTDNSLPFLHRNRLSGVDVG